MSGEPLAHGWVILTKRFGGDFSNPTAAELEGALHELFAQDASDSEHPDAWLRYGYDDGPTCVLTFTYRRGARFEEWADQDYGSELVPRREARDVSDAEALTLWKHLASGDLEAVRTWRWETSGR